MRGIHHAYGNAASLPDIPVCSATVYHLWQDQVAEHKTQAGHMISPLTWELQYFEEFEEQVNWVQPLFLDYFQMQGYTS